MLRESQHVAQGNQVHAASDEDNPKKRKAAAVPAERVKRARRSSDAADASVFPHPTDVGVEEDPPTTNAADARTTRYTIHISDTKTRTTPDLPPEEDSVSHHLQLMLYHRFLSCLLAKPEGTDLTAETNRKEQKLQPLDFNALWRRLSLNPQRPFSDVFIRGARRLLQRRNGGASSGNTAFECLDDLVCMWRKAVDDLNVDDVDDTLTLEYSLQTPEGAEESEPGTALQRQVTPRATDEGMADAGASSQESDVTLVGASQASDVTDLADEDAETQAKDKLPKGLLGVKTFRMDDHRLDEHLRSILRWWHGQRRPKGVPKELERRCEWVDISFAFQVWV